MKRAIIGLLFVDFFLFSIGCGTAPPVECPADGVELYFVNCPNDPTAHICNDAVGRRHAVNCEIHQTDGTLFGECVASCP